MSIENGNESWEVAPEDPSLQGGFDGMVRGAYVDWVKGNLEAVKKSGSQNISETPEGLHWNLIAQVTHSTSKEDIMKAYIAWNDAERDRARDSGDPEAALWFEVRLAFTQMMMSMPEEACNTLAIARQAAIGFIGSTPSLYDHIDTIMEILGWKDAQPDPYG